MLYEYQQEIDKTPAGDPDMDECERAREAHDGETRRDARRVGAALGQPSASTHARRW